MMDKMKSSSRYSRYTSNNQRVESAAGQSSKWFSTNRENQFMVEIEQENEQIERVLEEEDMYLRFESFEKVPPSLS